MNYLIETKTEYTTQLVNIIAPIMHDGITALYDQARSVSVKDEELKMFQSLLRQIPTWSTELLEKETQRILTECNCPELLQDLVKAVIKANIMVLTNTPPEQKSKLKITFDIEFPQFVHKCYIVIARNIYYNPYLYYHDYSLYEQKRNQRDAIQLIKDSVVEAIRKMLPMRLILDEYLGSSFKEEQEDFDKTITEGQRNKLNGLLLADGSKPPTYTLAKSDAAPSLAAPTPVAAPPKVASMVAPAAGGSKHAENRNDNNNDEADSVSYYRKPTIEDTFSNHGSVKRVVLNKDNQPVRDSYTIEMSNNGTDIESIRKKLGERFKRNAPEMYKF